MFMTKEAAMGSVARGGNDHGLYIGRCLDVLRTFIKHRFSAMGRFCWVVSAWF